MAVVRDRAARAWLSTRPPTLKKYPLGRSRFRCQRPLDIVRDAAEIATGHAGLDGNPPTARFAPNGARRERLLDRGELPERNPQPFVTVNQERPDGVDVASLVFLQPHDQVKSLLADPHFRYFLADQSNANRSDHVAWRESHASGGFAVDDNAQLRQSRQLFRSEIRNASDASHQIAGLLREPSQLVQLRPEDPNGHVGGRPTQSFVDAHAEGCREEDGHSGHALESSAHPLFELLHGAVPLRFQNHEHIRHRGEGRPS